MSDRICDFCKLPAEYDGKTKMGPWAFMCQTHFEQLCNKTPGFYKKLSREEITVKTCSRCGKEKAISEFYRYTDSSGITRYRNECKPCNLEERKIANCRRARRNLNK